MGQLLWYLQESGALGLLRLFARPVLVLLLLYQSSAVAVALRLLVRRFVPGAPEASTPLPDALVLIPTLISNDGAVRALEDAIRSVVTNGYPGRLTVCVAVDDASRHPALVAHLERWIDAEARQRRLDLVLVPVPRRVGKAMAMELAIERLQSEVESGDRASFPPLFFNLDADSALGPRALERLARVLTTPRSARGDRPFIVTSNVVVRKAHYWKGFRHFLTLPGQLAIQAAREFTNSISIGRHATRLIPVTTVSGALYCTWSRLHLEAPRFGTFLSTLRWRDWFAWWLGRPAPRFDPAAHAPHLESTIGPGDDTWISWLALGARWDGDRVDLGLPPTPLDALLECVRGWRHRPIAYAADAIVATSSPVTVRALWKQRVRWNSSRMWLVQRRGLSLAYAWSVAWPVLVDLFLLFAVHAAIVVGLLLVPFTSTPAAWIVSALLLQLLFIASRAVVTLLALLQGLGVRENWQLLLALPLSAPFHVVFNVATTITGFAHELFGRGVNTGFAPEETLAKCGTGRVALGYRMERLVRVAWRALVSGDVPFGAFWFGWEETAWTRNGYSGWTDPAVPRNPVKPRTAPPLRALPRP